MQPLHIFTSGLLLLSLQLHAQDAKTIIQSAGQRQVESLRQGRAAEISAFYAPEAVVMPEFHSILYGSKSIGQYFDHWLRSTAYNRVTRQITDIREAGAFAIEAGTFRQQFGQTGKDTSLYNAKYLRVWNLRDRKAPRIVAEIWGSVQWLERSVLPQIPDFPAAAPASSIAPAVAAQITQRNEQIRKLVSARNGAAHAQLFAPDAIYMPYYEQMHVGFDSVQAYFVRHERPDDLLIDSLDIRYANMIQLSEDLVLENGYYKVRWHTKADPAGGTGSGKSVNIWKKGKDGEWKLFRQMVNHD